MYKASKKLAVKLLPKKLLFRYELYFRSVLYFFYKGSDYKCNICGKNLRKFIEINTDRLCPNCGSIGRDRSLWFLLNHKYLKQDISVLDFSPSRPLQRKLNKISGINYNSTDKSGNFIADFSFDITNIAVEDESFDLIICYHILEHVIDDLKAMKELSRVLKNDGYCLIQTPFKEGDIFEDNSVTSKKEREKFFGQDDHVRIYSVNGLKDRLERCGFNVRVTEINKTNDAAKYGLKSPERVLICEK